MQPHQSLWAELGHTFEQDIPATEELLELLQHERKALEERNYDGFQQLMSSKQGLLSQLEQHAATRQRLLQQAGFNDEPSTLMAAEQQSPKVAKAWRKLGKQWAQCQELNEINDRIGQRTRLVVGQILDLLRGQNGQERLYTGKGSTSTRSGGRRITSA
jgi:flagellar biosynthesis protein FlgN